MQVYNVRKLHFQANLCEVLAEDQKQHDRGDFVLGWAVLPKRLSSTTSRQDFNQNVGEVLT